MYEVVTHSDAGAFLLHAEASLLASEAENNLILSLAYGLRNGPARGSDVFFATVRDGGAVVGCCMRTPPHKLLVTDMPLAAAGPLARHVAEEYDDLPAVLGPARVAEAVAVGWVDERGGGWRPGTEQRIYRLDSVERPDPVPGFLRKAGPDDIELAVAWAEGFARDTGVRFATRRESVERWVESGLLYLWEDGEPRSIAVAHGHTPNGLRIGYVYTPPEARRRGYASACVATLSQLMLDSGRTFCVLYTDLSNPTSNAIYQRMGYRPIADVRDIDLVQEGLA